jgi:hypothetical protein
MTTKMCQRLSTQIDVDSLYSKIETAEVAYKIGSISEKEKIIVIKSYLRDYLSKRFKNKK